MDFLRLRRHKIIEVLKQGLPGNISKSLNVLTVSDNVLFSWDFNSHCVLTLNVKATINNEFPESIICQKLLPICPPVFLPEKVVANEKTTLLVVAGRNGVLVFHLPKRCPPFGAFSNNKELVYCRTHNLDERLLMCNENVDMLQVRFHPGSLYNNHILLLTSDNTLRLYKIENEVIRLGVYQVGEKPSASMPGSKMTFLGALGETAIDFDFGHPEDNPDKPVKLEDPFSTSIKKKPAKPVESCLIIYHDQKDEKLEKLKEREDYELFNWPVYVLSGDFVVTCIIIPLYETSEVIKEYPIPIIPSEMLKYDRRACSILCLDSSPQVVCIGSTNGEILHGLVLSNDKNELAVARIDDKEAKGHSKSRTDREIYLFEAVDIELGLTTTTPQEEEGYTCAIFLHKDEARCERYYATHSAGVHCITISCMEELQNESSKMFTDDIFTIRSTPEYLICTKTSTSKTFNPVLGFAPFYNPNSILTLLANGNLLSLGIMTSNTVSQSLTKEAGKNSREPAKLPFLQYIQNLLKKETHPIIKLSSEHTLKESHELIQATAQVLKEKFKQHMIAKEQIQRRYLALKIFTEYQVTTLKTMAKEKQMLKEAAENLAEKYEDTRDKQEILLKRTAKLLIMIAMKKEVLSEAEQDYLDQLAKMRKKLDECDSAVEKLITKKSYQETQIRNWKNEHSQKNAFFNDTHRDTIKDTLVSTSIKINEMVDEIKRVKKLLNLN